MISKSKPKASLQTEISGISYCSNENICIDMYDLQLLFKVSCCLDSHPHKKAKAYQTTLPKINRKQNKTKLKQTIKTKQNKRNKNP